MKIASLSMLISIYNGESYLRSFWQPQYVFRQSPRHRIAKMLLLPPRANAAIVALLQKLVLIDLILNREKNDEYYSQNDFFQMPARRLHFPLCASPHRVIYTRSPPRLTIEKET